MKSRSVLMAIAIAYTIFNPTRLLAQELEDNPVFKQNAEHMFEHTDRNKIPTGILLDYGMDLIDFTLYDGALIADSNYVDIPVFESMLRSIRSSTMRGTFISSVSKTMSSFSRHQIANNLNVGISVFKYNYIKANALDDNLIEYEAEQVRDVYLNGVWQNPYADAYIIGFTPEAHQCYTGNVCYTFPKTYLFSNVDIINIEFDAGDGDGYRQIGIDSKIDISYTSSGKKELKLRVKLNSREILEAHSYIYVSAQLPTTSNSEKILPDNKYDRSTTYGGKTVEAGVSIKYAPGHTSITKPFIFVEGFDPWRLKAFEDEDEEGDIREGHTKFEDVFKSVSDNNDFMSTEFYRAGYDFIYIDWYNSEEDIRANAELLKMILNELNQEKKQSDSKEKNVIMAQSMGGLVARYALRDMEMEGIRHETAMFVTQDTPHLGANVPLGLLYGIQQLLSLYSGYTCTMSVVDLFSKFDIGEAEATLCDILYSSTSVKQMLFNYVNASGRLDNSVSTEWQRELQAMGLPQGDIDCPINNCAISNGNTVDQSYLKDINNHYLYIGGYLQTRWASDLLLTFVSPAAMISPLIMFILMELKPCIFGSTRIDIQFSVEPFTSSGCKLSEFKVVYTKKWLWMFKKEHVIFSDTKYAPTNDLTYDIFPGSTYQTGKVTNNEEQEEEKYVNIQRYDKNAFAEYQFSFQMAKEFMFIPVASALNVMDKNGETYYGHFVRNYFINPPKTYLETPFTGLFLYDQTQEHTTIINDVYEWMWNQLHMNIIGDDAVYGTALYTIEGYNGNVKWSVSNEDVATINPDTGELTEKECGFVTVYAESYINGRKYFKSKMIRVGFPNMILGYSYDYGSGYTVKAQCINHTEQHLLNAAIDKGYVKFIWGQQDATGKLLWKPISSSSEYSIGIPEKNEVVTVFLQMKDNYGKKSKVYSIEVNKNQVVQAKYEGILIDKNKKVFLSHKDGYDIGLEGRSYSIRIPIRELLNNDSSNGYSDEYSLMIDACGLVMPATISKHQGYIEYSFDLFSTNYFKLAFNEVLNKAGCMPPYFNTIKLTLYYKNNVPVQKMSFVILTSATVDIPVKPIFPPLKPPVNPPVFPPVNPPVTPPVQIQ